MAGERPPAGPKWAGRESPGRSGDARPGGERGAGSLRAMSAAGPVPVAAPAAPAPPPRPSAVRPVPFDELAAVIASPAPPAGDQAGPEITGVTLRASDVRSGDLFAALPGARAHGADFAAEALARGAVAILTDPDGVRRLSTAQEPDRATLPLLVHPDPRGVLGAVAAHVYGDPTAHLRVVGVTGTS